VEEKRSQPDDEVADPAKHNDGVVLLAERVVETAEAESDECEVGECVERLGYQMAEVVVLYENREYLILDGGLFMGERVPLHTSLSCWFEDTNNLLKERDRERRVAMMAW